MKIFKATQLDFIVDKLTNSIQNTISGDSFATDVLRLTKADFSVANLEIDATQNPEKKETLLKQS